VPPSVPRRSSMRRTLGSTTVAGTAAMMVGDRSSLTPAL
jgi:hypothetical protein